MFPSTSVAEELFSDNPIDWLSRLGLDLRNYHLCGELSQCVKIQAKGIEAYSILKDYCSSISLGFFNPTFRLRRWDMTSF